MFEALGDMWGDTGAGRKGTEQHEMRLMQGFKGEGQILENRCYLEGQVRRAVCYLRDYGHLWGTFQGTSVNLEKLLRGNRWYLQGQMKRTGHLQGTGTRSLMLPGHPDVGN